MSRSLVCMLLSLERSSSSWVLMNEDTRRLSRMPEEVKTELEPISAFPPRYVRLICMSLFRFDNLSNSLHGFHGVDHPTLSP